jgi:prolyl-tRNA editing enzyme YbaK/EbsC (Cys-tRNA(Pro) deacylase)
MGVWEDLEARVTALEQKKFQMSSHDHSSNSDESDDGAKQQPVVDEQMRRARKAVEEANVYSAVWKWVPTDYYQRPLSERAKCLTGSSTRIEYLCKSLLLENKKCTSPNDENPRYVLVILQYAATLDEAKLTNVIRRRVPLERRLDPNQYDWRVASSEDNDRLTGYQHNSVTPFGLQDPHSEVTIVLTETVIPLGFFWMGGGHVHLKLGVATSDFITAFTNYGPTNNKKTIVIGDISNPRVGGDSTNEEDD